MPTPCCGEHQMMNNGEQNQVNQLASWLKVTMNLLAMICIYATSAAVTMLFIYWMAVWLGLTD